MFKYLGSNPVSILTTITGLIVVAFPLFEQYQNGTLSPWMLGAGLAGAIFVRLTDEGWTNKVRSRIDK